MLLSSGKVPLGEGDLEDFEEKLEAVCGGLAEDCLLYTSDAADE